VAITIVSIKSPLFISSIWYLIKYRHETWAPCQTPLGFNNHSCQWTLFHCSLIPAILSNHHLCILIICISCQLHAFFYTRARALFYQHFHMLPRFSILFKSTIPLNIDFESISQHWLCTYAILISTSIRKL